MDQNARQLVPHSQRNADWSQSAINDVHVMLSCQCRM